VGGGGGGGGGSGCLKISSNCANYGLYAWLVRVTASTRLTIKYSVLSTSLSTTGLPTRMIVSMGTANTCIIIGTITYKYLKLSAQLVEE
jgi:hypothetical protein